MKFYSNGKEVTKEEAINTFGLENVNKGIEFVSSSDSESYIEKVNEVWFEVFDENCME